MTPRLLRGAFATVAGLAAVGCSAPPPRALAAPATSPPADAAPPPAPPAPAARQLYLGPGIACIRRPGDRYACWGARFPLPVDAGVETRSPPVFYGGQGSLDLPGACFDQGTKARCWPPLTPAPADLHGGAPAAVSVGGARCVLGAAGSVGCWDDRNRYLELPELAGSEKIVPGDGVCGFFPDARLVCVTLRGTDFIVPRTRPEPLRFTGVVQTALDGALPCVLRRSGEVSCWHRGSLEILPVEGVPPTQALHTNEAWRILADAEGGAHVVETDGLKRLFARRVDVPPVREIALGSRRTCFLTRADEVYCTEPSSGSDSRDRPLSTRHVEGLDHALELAAAEDTVCALDRSGAVRCFGDNALGQLGEGFAPSPAGGFSGGQPRYLSSAAGVLRLGAWPPARAERVAGWPLASLFVGPNGDTWGVGQDGRVAWEDLGCGVGEEPHRCDPPFFDDVYRAYRSARPDDTRQVWGLGRSPPGSPDPFPPVSLPWRHLPAPRQVVEVAGVDGAPGGGADVRTKAGDVWRVTIDARGRPQVKRIASDVRRVPARGCRIDRSDDLVCDETAYCPAELSTTRDASMTSSHGCAVRRDGSVWCWGESSDGQLGTPPIEGRGDCTGGNSAIPDRHAYTPARVAGLDDVQQVGTGKGDDRDVYGPREGSFSCALRRDGTVWCWGSNGVGQLGARREPDAFRPARVEGVDGVTQLAVGPSQVCVVASRGLLCWGRSYVGTPWASTPVEVALPEIGVGASSAATRAK
jgi:Regulator of chromosome condensation (RCC1) repeat